MQPVSDTETGASIILLTVTRSQKRLRIDLYSQNDTLLMKFQAYRWIQLTLVASKELETQGLLAKNCGYQYIDPVDNIEKVECHVDAIPNNILAGIAVGSFGAHLSVRRDVNKPIVVFIGQDEAIFKQFSFLSKMWTGPKGERPLLPKDEGAE